MDIRPISPNDGERLVAFHERLSSESQRLRFFSVHPRLRDTEVERFVNVDGERRVALVAIDGDEIIGVARFDRAADSTDAEVAFVVLDECQHQGIGTALFECLTEIAREKGIERFVANILPENRPMIGLALHDHPGATSEYAGGVVVASIPLTH